MSAFRWLRSLAIISICIACPISAFLGQSLNAKLVIVTNTSAEWVTRMSDTLAWVNGPFTAEVLIHSHQSKLMMTEEQLKFANCSQFHQEREVEFSAFFLADQGNQNSCIQLNNQYLYDKISLIAFWRNRYRISIEFQLPSTRCPIALFWAHFRGNAQLSYLSHIPPGGRLRQYTNAGHLFIAIESENEQEFLANDGLFSAASFPWERIASMYLIPARFQSSISTLPIILSHPFRRLYNLHRLELELEHHLAIPPVTTNRFESLVLFYWQRQRNSQMHVNSWALPSVQPNLDGQLSVPSLPILSATSLYAVRNLSTSSAINISMYYQHYRDRAQVEPIISMVFNQRESSTYYVPLPVPHLLRQLESEVLEMVAAWTNTSSKMWESTGTYACREYRAGAIIRWHVDPADTQPVTAIIHVAHSYDESGQQPNVGGGDVITSWPLQVPHTVTGLPRDVTSITNIDNIHLLEGQVLLMQSAKLPHARFLPLQRGYYANILMHFRPKGWTEHREVQLLSS